TVTQACQATNDARYWQGCVIGSGTIGLNRRSIWTIAIVIASCRSFAAVDSHALDSHFARSTQAKAEHNIGAHCINGSGQWGRCAMKRDGEQQAGNLHRTQRHPVKMPRRLSAWVALPTTKRLKTSYQDFHVGGSFLRWIRVTLFCSGASWHPCA